MEVKLNKDLNAMESGEEVRMKGKADPVKEPECSSYAHIRVDCGMCNTLMFQQSQRLASAWETD